MENSLSLKQQPAVRHGTQHVAEMRMMWQCTHLRQWRFALSQHFLSQALPVVIRLTQSRSLIH